MRHEVIDTDQGKTVSDGESLGIVESDQQGGDQSRSLSDGDGIKIRKRDSCLLKSCSNHRIQCLEMFSCGKLRHDTAVGRMGRDLRSDNA